ncbi:hypothetical protein Rsub_12565 [Raphidocelis subcapitata]|uniref:Amidinotransferase n=1 Tax=Raphidocelis subcapitata TaxID=307507 RepID=A0A2V0PL83_9CHLO|nr:hypothetical protein Rsub_12565 [Raphidocelis subcapitata]|eukprot:GBF99812.1 hypothetical protein Rsub_12565 [Raphidocelis subcapitata]
MIASIAGLAAGGAGSPSLAQWGPIAARRAYSVMTQAAEALALPGSTDDAVLLRLPQRPFGATAELPDSVAPLVKGAGRVAVVREAFAPSGVKPQELSQIVAPLGPRAVALSAASQEDAGAVVVDEYRRDPKTGRFALSRVAACVADFLAEQGVRAALVPDVRAAAAAAAASAPNAVREVAGGASPQSTNHVLMVAPTAFGFNEQAAQDNSFMHAGESAAEGGSALTRQVLREFSALHRQLTDFAGVRVSLMQHAVSHGTPDACFPNNWISTHAAREGGGAGAGAERSLVLYPMKCPNRAAERRPDIIAAVQAAHGPYARVVDLTGAERAGEPHYFEGTGVLVLDRVNGVAYVNLSERAHEALARQWVEALGYNELVTFRSTDLRGKPVYHTNVMMAVGTGVAVVCGDSVADPKERRRLLDSLAKSHEVVQISLEQMDALCGNVLELRGGHGLPVLAMSTQAHNAFTEDQRRAMRRHVAALVHAPIDTLESVGGGGVRCALAELF